VLVVSDGATEKVLADRMWKQTTAFVKNLYN
jgi:hypothetical protein